MYQITANGAFLGYTDSPEYCYKLPSGSPQVIGPVERGNGAVATGIIFQGTVYNLLGHSDFEGAETAYISDIDEGAIITQNTKDIAQEKTNLGGQKAERPYQPGEFITIGGQLYRVKLPILVGAFITPGTNVEATDIATELTKLNLGGN
jgi:hypothetical protein